MKIKKGDTVIVVTGKDAGKKGKVIQAMPSENRVIVENVNMVTKHKKPTQRVQQGGIVHQEAPINVSNVMIVDPKLCVATKVGYKVNEKGDKVRIAKKSGEILD